MSTERTAFYVASQPDMLPAGGFGQGLRAFLRDRMAILGLIVLAAAVLAALLAPLLSPYDPDAGDGASILSPPFSAGHILGADEQGRDILSRILFGARLAFPEAVIPAHSTCFSPSPWCSSRSRLPPLSAAAWRVLH